MDIITFLLCALVVKVIIQEWLERTGRMKQLREKNAGRRGRLVLLVAVGLICVAAGAYAANMLGAGELVYSITGGVILGIFLPFIVSFRKE